MDSDSFASKLNRLLKEHYLEANTQEAATQTHGFFGDFQTKIDLVSYDPSRDEIELLLESAAERDILNGAIKEIENQIESLQSMGQTWTLEMIRAAFREFLRK